jgi:hypothetical protein
MASGVNNTARQVGIAAGIAGLGAVFQARLAGDVEAGLIVRGVPPSAADRAAQLAAAADPEGAAISLGPAGSALPGLVDTAFVAALQTVFLIAIGITVLGIVVVVALIRPAPADDTSSRRS